MESAKSLSTWKQRLRAWDSARRRRRRGELTYAEWVTLYDTPNADMRQTWDQRLRCLSLSPRISILMPVYNPRLEWLREALDSVCGQVYPNWELCIADDVSTDPAVGKLLNDYASRDPRIRVMFRQRNGHISAASNSALELATGQYVALLDHDDLLPAHALLCVAETIAKFPDAMVIYSDEDKVDENGERCEPYFKCDWNPELFRCYNMISHLGVYQAELVRSVGGFRLGFEGAQDYDLALRCVETVTTPQQILHIPHVLYHWRIHSDSTSGGNATKPYALEAGRKAIMQHLSRCDLAGKVQAHAAGWYEIDYRIPQPEPKVAVVVIDSGRAEALSKCLDNVQQHWGHRHLQVTVVSTKKRTHRKQGASLVHLCNQSALATSADILMFLDSACEIPGSGALDRLLSFAARPQTGAVSPKLVFDERIVGGGIVLGLRGTCGVLYKGLISDEIGYFGRAALSQNLTALGDGCLVVGRAAFESVGGYSPAYRCMTAGTIDLCLKLNQAGLRNVWVPSVQSHTHAHHGSLNAWAFQLGSIRKKGIAMLMRSWPTAFLRDPAYSPNLTLARENFALANPPRVNFSRPWFD